MNIYACAADVVFNKYRLTICVDSYILGSNAEHGHMHVAALDGFQSLVEIRHKALAENKAVWMNIVSFALLRISAVVKTPIGLHSAAIAAAAGFYHNTYLIQKLHAYLLFPVSRRYFLLL